MACAVGSAAAARAAGLTPERKETLIHYVHAHLDVFVNGRPEIVPAGIGINPADPGVHGFTAPDGSTAYGGIQLCDVPRISPLHTHDDSGIVHTESASPVPNRLGQFFTEWRVRLTPLVRRRLLPPDQHRDLVNGNRHRGDPPLIQLIDHKEIAVVIGTPPKKIPHTADFSNA